MASEQFSQALTIVASPSSMQEAVNVFRAFGVEILLALAIPLMVVVALGAVIEGGRGRKLWDYKGYWLLVFFLILSDIMVLFILPFLIQSF